MPRHRVRPGRRSEPIRCGFCFSLLPVAERKDPKTCGECGAPLCLVCDAQAGGRCGGCASRELGLDKPNDDGFEEERS